MKTDNTDRLIVTAAHQRDVRSLVSWVGALNLNWPGHPPLLIYDLGLEPQTVSLLHQHAIATRKVPAFCPHWHRHNTWKLWCLADAPARELLWMNVDLLALRPLDEAFEAVAARGHFLVGNGELLEWEASFAACRGCGLPPEFRRGKPALAGALVGVDKTGRQRQVLDEALAAALVEEQIAASEVTHRIEQALLALLFHKHASPLILVEPDPYLLRGSPTEVPGQKTWLHGGWLRREDVNHLGAHLSSTGAPHVPAPLVARARAQALAHFYRAYWHFGRGDLGEATRRIAATLATDPTLAGDPQVLARAIREYESRTRVLAADPALGGGFVEWTLAAIERSAGVRPARLFRSALLFEPVRA